MAINETYDKYGNRLYCENGTVFLELASGMKKTIGTVSEDGTTFHCYRKVGKHTFNTVGEIGINYSMVKRTNLRWFEVELSNGKRLQTSRKWIEKYGSVRLFKKQGYELQYFLKEEQFQGFVEPEEVKSD